MKKFKNFFILKLLIYFSIFYKYFFYKIDASILNILILKDSHFLLIILLL